MGKIWIGLIILILILGGIFLSCKYFYQERSDNVGTLMTCNIGHNTLISTPFGTASGKITGIEKYNLLNGETKNLCCREVETEDNIKMKVCEEKNDGGIFIYRLMWKFTSVSGEYIKYSEYIPQFDAQCTNYFDSNGDWESRSCEESPTTAGSQQSQEIPSEDEEYSTTEDCEALQDEVKKVLCYREVAPLLRDISLCDILGSNLDKQICYQKVAIALRDPSICELITESVLKNIKSVCLREASK